MNILIQLLDQEQLKSVHDFNDYSVAKKHKLDFFKLMDESACLLNEDFIPKKYRGLKDLKQGKFL